MSFLTAGCEHRHSNLERTNVIGIAIAAMGGAAVGLEREWSGHAGGAEARFAGIRTFTLLGGIWKKCRDRGGLLFISLRSKTR